MAINRNFRNIFAVLLILWGIFAALTPLTPGSWLAFVGLFMILGRKRTEEGIERILGKKLFYKLGIKNLLNKLPYKPR